jgi:two-component sensor histidine kinase
MPRTKRSAVDGGGGDSDRRIAANLSILADVLHRYAVETAARGQGLSPRDVSVVIGGVAARIEMLGRLHRDLAAEPGAREINLSACLRSICEDLGRTLPPPGRIVLSHQLARDCMVPIEEAVPLALITCEIVGNSVRHAHPADVIGFINVCCWREPSGEFVLDIADDGVGLPPGFDPATESGFGLRLVRQLSEHLGGSCAFDDSGLGLHFRLRIPAPGTAPAENPPLVAGGGGLS